MKLNKEAQNQPWSSISRLHTSLIYQLIRTQICYNYVLQGSQATLIPCSSDSAISTKTIGCNVFPPAIRRIPQTLPSNFDKNPLGNMLKLDQPPWLLRIVNQSCKLTQFGDHHLALSGPASSGQNTGYDQTHSHTRNQYGSVQIVGHSRKDLQT